MSDDTESISTILARLIVTHGEDHVRWVMKREEHPKPAPDQIKAARKLHGGDTIDIDDDAYLSDADEGYWVSAWVWVDYDQCPACNDPMPNKVCENDQCPLTESDDKQEMPHAI